MSTVVQFRFSATGPREDVESLRDCVEKHARKKKNDGEFALSTAWWNGFPGDKKEAIEIVPERLFHDPVELMGGEATIEGYAKWVPPLVFLKGVSELFPQLDCRLSSWEMGNNVLEEYLAIDGVVEQISRRNMSRDFNQILRWVQGDKSWEWKEDPDADIGMLETFLALNTDEEFEDGELHAICETAYTTIAWPDKICRQSGSGLAYDLTTEIRDRRIAFRKYRDSLSPVGRIAAELLKRDIEDDEFVRELESAASKTLGKTQK